MKLVVMQQVAWLAMGVVGASCGYPELSRLTGADAPGDDAPGGDAPGGDAPATQPPQFSSCMGLPATCGPGANANCCRTSTIPGGTFHRGYDASGLGDMSSPATVSMFVLDTYEVTVGRFRRFVDANKGTQASPPAAGSGAHPNLAGSGWDSAWTTGLATDTAALKSAIKCSATYQTWTDSPGATEDRPMNCLSWYQAMAFCIWDGGYLPTEAEWHYAASGGSAQRAYPWSNPAGSTSIDCTYANYKIDNPSGTYCANGTTGAAIRVGSESPKGDGRWGHSDLAGNVWEWTLDRDGVYPLPCDDCANLTASTQRVLRGGSLRDVTPLLRAYTRFSTTPDGRSYAFGVRCARTPPATGS